MLVFLCLVFSCSADSNPEGDARRLVPTSKYRWGTEDDLIRSLISSHKVEASRNEKRQLENDDIFSDLSDLVSDQDRDRLTELLNSGGNKIEYNLKNKLNHYRCKQDTNIS